ncbi:FGGY-family carbohydrate kinase [Enterobacter hormaechei]|uniref:FGGY-family carbohydrate kinase n=1 Tax=Enterobacter hormaechei TaxID=158836 RepID=UPI0038849CF4
MSEKEPFWLGIDCGGTYLKAGLYNSQGKEVCIERRSVATLSPRAGYAERDMHQLWQHCHKTVALLLKNSGADGGQIKGVGISAQGKGLFLLDKQDRPLGNAILSSDRRALEIVQRWQQDGIPEKLYPHTRQTLWTGHPASLLRWVKENEPQRYQQIGSVMMAHDYLRWCLTGVKGCEESNISESNLYNMNTGQYDPQLTRWLGISDIDGALPSIIGSAEICGEITAQAAALTGLTAGTPVVGGLFDVVSTAICAGLEMTSGFYGLQALHTRAHLLQAVYEGVVFSHMTHLNRMLERFPHVQTLRVTGGPTHSDVWMQMLADVSGLAIELPQVEETGCSGAALAALVGTGLYPDFYAAQRALRHDIRMIEPDMRAHAAYQRKYHRYQLLISALQGYHARVKEYDL